MTALLVIALIIYCIYLTSRLNKLERRLETSGTGQVITPEPIQEHSSPALATSTPSLSSAESTSRTNQSDSVDRFTRWLTTDWLLKLGAFLLILGIAWFVNYAFAENWIGPVGRVTLGFVAGSAVLLFGEYWNKRSPLQATVFMVVGVTAILLTTYAARTVYDFFTPVSATVLMAAAVVMMSYSSVLHKIENRAILSIIFAALVPFLTASTDTSVIGLLTYGFVICTGFLWIVSLTGWRKLSAVALIIYAVYSLLSMYSYSQEDIFLLRVLVFAYTLLFYAVGLITHLQVKQPSAFDFIVSLGNAFIMILWIQRVEAEHLASVLTCIGALAFFLGAYLLFKNSSKPAVILEYTAIALGLVAIAATFELEGPVLSITYSLLICVGVFLTQAITRNIKNAQMAGFLLIPAFFHSLVGWLDSRSYRASDITNTGENLVTWWILAAELAGLGFYFYKQARTSNDTDAITNAAVYLIGGLVLSLFSLWETVSFFVIPADTSHAISLVIFTIAGLALHIYGRLSARKKTMYSGAGVLGFVIFRLLLVEIWSMDLFQRVIIFSLIGVLLMATAFIKPQQKEK